MILWRITYRIGFYNRESGRLALACSRRLESGMRRKVRERGKNKDHDVAFKSQSL